MGDYNRDPLSRNEEILRATIDGTEYRRSPMSAEEELLLELKEKIERLGIEAVVTEDVTAKYDVGAIASGDKVLKNTTFTDFVKQLLTIKEIAPTIEFSAPESGVKEKYSMVSGTLTLTITSLGTGTPVSVSFYKGSTLLETMGYVNNRNTYTHVMSGYIMSDTTVKGVLNYNKSDGTASTVEGTESYKFVAASYYGAVTTAPTTRDEIVALTKSVKDTKAQTAIFELNNQRSCYCYPVEFGDLSSIKDANNLECLSSYTKTTVTVPYTATYNVYTLTDPVTASAFKQVYS